MSPEGPQVLDTFTRFTATFKGGQNPEPCRTWGHTASHPSPPFSRFQGVPALQGRGTLWRLDVREWKRKRTRFFLKSLLSHSVAAVIIQPYL